MATRLFNFIERKQLATLGLLWVLVQAVLFYIYGVNSSLESLKYIGAAQELLYRGDLPETRYFFYLTTTLIIAACIKTGVGFAGVVIIQLTLNLFATISFFKALKKIEQNKFSAFFTVCLLISFLPYQTWNFFLYTESVFYSCALLFFSSCLYYKEATKKASLIQAFFLFLTIISRPLGIIFLPCWILFLIQKKKIKPSVFIPVFLITIVAAILIVNTIMGNISDWKILKSAEYGHIICDMPAREKLNLENIKQHSPLTQLSLFIIQHPAEFLDLSVKRMKAFFLLTRYYYSSPHNIYLLFYAALFALPLLANIILYRKKKPDILHFSFSLLIIAGFSLTVALQCDDYHNRFHHTIVPVFLYTGFFLLIEKYRSINLTNK